MHRRLWAAQIVIGLFFIFIGIQHPVVLDGLPGLATTKPAQITVWRLGRVFRQDRCGFFVSSRQFSQFSQWS